MYRGEIRSLARRYSELAVQQGRQNLPPSHATGPDEHEVKLIADARSHAVSVDAEYEASVTDAKNQTEKLRHTCHELRSRCEALLADTSLENLAKQTLTAERRQLIDAKAEELRLQAEVNGFKAEHNLSRTAHYPRDNVLHFALIAICIAVETVMNAFFYENAQGLLGGAVVALGVSVLNVGLAGVLGYFFTYSNHRDTGRQIFGWLCLAAFLFSTVYLNSVFATFRAEYQLIEDPTEFSATTEAFGRALAAATAVFLLNIPFRDALSFILFFLGCLISLFAFYKGYTYDDPYPGYGALHRRYAAAAQRTREALNALRTSLRGALEKHRAERSEVRSALTTQPTRVSAIRSELLAARNRRDSALHQIELDFKLVLEAYRQGNTSVRTTPAPPAFSEVHSIVRTSGDADTHGVEAALSALAGDFEDTKTRFLQPLAERVQQLLQDESRLLGEEFDAFTTQVEREAQELIARQSQVRVPGEPLRA